MSRHFKAAILARQIRDAQPKGSEMGYLAHRSMVDSIVSFAEEAGIGVEQAAREVHQAVNGNLMNNDMSDSVVSPVTRAAVNSAVAAARAANASGEQAKSPYYYDDAVHVLRDMYAKAHEGGVLVDVVVGFDLLFTHEPHRIHRLMISLKKGRTDDVIGALMNYGPDDTDA